MGLYKLKLWNDFSCKQLKTFMCKGIKPEHVKVTPKTGKKCAKPPPIAEPYEPGFGEFYG
jgi:hypothetical protein